MATTGQLLDRTGHPMAMVKAHYEATQPSRTRSMMMAPVRDAAEDISSGTRKMLLAQSRELYRNNPLVRAIVERIITYTVGTGIIPEPDSSDPEWNDRAAKIYEEWAKLPDLTSKMNAGQVQTIALRAAIVDGDSFALKTYSKGGRRRIQLIEAHHVGDPSKSRAVDYCDGVNLDGIGRPESYVLRRAGGNDNVDADALVQFANIERPSQHRGVCLLAAAINTAIDLHDILALEYAQVKSAGAVTDVIKTASGEMEPGDMLQVVEAGATPDANVTRYYRENFGPEAVVMRHGDEFTPYEPKRPGPAWQGFVDFMAELVCLVFKLPPSLVRQLKVGGADTRRDLAAGQRTFEQLQLMIAQAWQEIYEYVIEGEIEDGALANPPADWRNVEWQFTRDATVDAGRQAQQDREDVRTGAMTLRQYCAQYGMSYRKHIRQLKAEMRDVNPNLTISQIEAILITRLFGGPNGTSIPADTAAPELTDSTAKPGADAQDNAAAAGDVQAAALNGAQVTALVEIALKVASGLLTRESAKGIAGAAFPLLTPAQLAAIFDSIIKQEQPQQGAAPTS